MDDLLDFPLLFSGPDRLSGFSAWTQHIPFAMTLMKFLRPRTFVELGTHGGDSYCAFCRAVQDLQIGTKCHAVDTWQGDEHASFYESDVLRSLREYHDPRYGDFSHLLQMKFDAARDRFADGSIDLLHIDGLHTYEAVRHDFETWLPAMSARGVVLFHDTQERERNFGVWKLWAELSPRYEHFEFSYGHGLGVLAVGTDVPREFLTLLNAAKERAVVTSMFESLGLRWSLTQELDNCEFELEESRAEVVALQAQAKSLAAQVDYYQKFRFRVAERLNSLLLRTGPVHRLAKESLRLVGDLTKRWRTPAEIPECSASLQLTTRPFELPDVIPLRPRATAPRQLKRAA